MILRLLILLLFSSFMKSQHLTEYDDEGSIDRKILRGHVLESTFDAPWSTLVLARSEKQRKTIAKCSGVLISDRHVVTAGHCILGITENRTGYFWRPDLEPWKGREGCEGGDMIVPANRVQKFIFKFNSPCRSCDLFHIVARMAKKIVLPGLCATFEHISYTDRNDFAIIELSEPVHFSDTIQAVKVSEAFPGDLQGTQVFVAGYGFDPTDRKSDYLKYYYSNGLIPCPPNGTPLTSWFCVYSLPESQMACPGDSGSGAIIIRYGRYELIGVLSAGKGCGRDIVGRSAFISIWKHYGDICNFTGVC